MSRQKDFPVLIRLFERIGFGVRLVREVLGRRIYLVDFSNLRVNLSDRTPVIDFLSSPGQIEPLEFISLLEDIVVEGGYLERIPIVMGDLDNPLVRQLASERWLYAVFLNNADLRAIVESKSPVSEFLEIASKQLPLSVFSPYETTRPVTASKFFGRESELRLLFARSNTNYAIVGARRIGKTSLLLEFLRSASKEHKHRVLYIDCSVFREAGDFVYELVTRLHIREITRLARHSDYRLYVPTFLDRMRKMHKGRIVLLLDEADKLIQLDKASNYPILHVLRRSANVGSCRCIFAGFRELSEQSMSLESPLFNFVNLLRLSALTLSQTRNLVLRPMTSLGIRLDSSEKIVRRMYKETGGHPNLIQIYCSALLQILDQEGRRVAFESDLDSIEGDEVLQRFVLGTFRANASPLEKVIVCALAHQKEFTLRDVDVVFKKRNIYLSSGRIEKACDSLSIAGILFRRGGLYRFVTPLLPQTLLDYYDVDWLLAKFIEEASL